MWPLGRGSAGLGTLLLLPWLVRGVIPPKVEKQLNEAFGVDLLANFTACEASSGACRSLFLDWTIELGKWSDELTTQFSDCPAGCGFQKNTCDKFTDAAHNGPVTFRDECREVSGTFPAQCVILLKHFERHVEDELFEIGTVCSIVVAETRDALPSCDRLARTTVARHRTLSGSGCQDWDRATCVSHYCGVYNQFFWRMNASNLQGEQEHRLGLDEGVLPGCETMAASGAFSLDNDDETNFAECEVRIDVAGLCDCFCGAFLDITPGFKQECPFRLDAFFLFGRLGVPGIPVPPECEENLCDVLEDYHDQSQCANLELPDKDSCLALSLPEQAYQPLYCPWLDGHSGEDGVLECLDGSRCNVNAEGWSCCEDNLGRAKCPQDLPVMCDELCSGTTEYCCRQDCVPRGCSLMLRADASQIYFSTVTETTITTSPPPAVEDESWLQIPEIEYSPWMLLWLLFLVPCLGVCAWHYRNKRQRFQEACEPKADPPAGMKSEHDKDGTFKKIAPPEKYGEKEERRVVDRVLIYEVPTVKPLGLEMEECKVTTVHEQGAKWGWQEGDIVVEVADKEVHSFKEIYQTVMAERHNLPLKILVKRLVSKVAAVQALPGQETKDSDSKKGSSASGSKKGKSGRKVAPDDDGEEERLRLAAAKAMRPPSPDSSTEEPLGLDDVHGDVPTELVGRWSPWCNESEVEVKPPKGICRDGIDFNVRTLTAQQEHAAAHRLKVRQAQKDAEEARRLWTDQQEFRSYKLVKPEVNIVKDAWGRAQFQYDGNG